MALWVDGDQASRSCGIVDERDGSGSIDIERLYRTHQVRLVRLATAITFERELAEEVVQDAFAGLQRHRRRVDRPDGYLQRSVVNLSVKALRRRRVAGSYVSSPPLTTGIPDIDETWIVVCRLPAKQRAVVALRYWEDLSEADIAAVLGWPAGTVKSTLHRALARLRKELPR